MEDILHDPIKFERLDADPVKLLTLQQHENQIKKCSSMKTIKKCSSMKTKLTSLKKSESITQATYKQLYPTAWLSHWYLIWTSENTQGQYST